VYNLSGDSLDGGGGWDGLGYGGYKYGVSVNLQAERVTDQFTLQSGVSDTVKGFEGVDGTNFADTIMGSDADNWIQGDGGYWGQARTASSGSSGDSLVGGAGWDNLGYIDSTSGVSVNLGTGRAIDSYGFEDTVEGFEAVNGSNFADTIIGSVEDNWIQGDSGNGPGAPRDNAWVSSADSLDGSGGNDTVSYKDDVAGVRVDLLAGRATDGYGFEDTLVGFEAVRGSSFNDTLIGDAGDNTLQGGSGSDSMFGGEGRDSFRGDDSGGNDTIDGGIGGDGDGDWLGYHLGTAGINANLQTGRVVKQGGTAFDTVSNIERLGGTNFADTIIGSIYDDWFEADHSYWGTSRVGITQVQQSSADYIDAGRGSDGISYGDDFAGVTVNLKTERAIDVFGGEDTIKGIENVEGSNFGDTITGSDGNNWISGDLANSGVNRSAGSLSSGDYLDGGAGRDTVSYADDSAGVTVNLQTGRATDGFGGEDTLKGFEMVEGSSFNDLIFGDIGKNSITGLAGNDTIYGGDGHDTIDGGDGNDSVFGGAGDDSITASRGDTIDGGGADGAPHA
jgi:Ca2+-binding RTX toxin-like protein